MRRRSSGTEKAQAAEHYALLQARVQEGEQLWLQLAILQEQAYRSAQGLEPTLLATPAPAGAAVLGAPTQEERQAAPAAPSPAPVDEDRAGIDGQAALEPGTPNSRQVLSLLSVTPAPTTGTYYGTPLEAWGPPPPADASAPLLTPLLGAAPTPSGQGFGLAVPSPLPSPLAAPLPAPSPGAPPQVPLLPASCQLPLVPSPPRHAAPVQSLDFSPEKAHADPPEREAFEGLAADEG